MEKRCYGCMNLKTQSPLCEHCGFNENINNLSHQLPLGTVLKNQYLIGKVLGQGGLGITYIGFDQNLQIPIAIKEYFPRGLVVRDKSGRLNASNDNAIMLDHGKRQFVKEARALAKLRKVPGVVQVHSTFEENNTAYIIMEYVSGINLQRYVNLRGGKLTAEETLKILKPIMESLHKVHGLNFIHRDISPENIMIRREGGVKLVDFGTAREVADPSVNQMLSRSTEVVPKYGYASMEHYRKSGSFGPWTDVYSLAAVAYFCMTGQVPPEAPTRLMDGMTLNWKSIPGLTERQVAALEKSMELDARKRFLSIAAMYRELYGTQIEAQEQKNAAPLDPVPNQAPAGGPPEMRTINVVPVEEMRTQAIITPEERREKEQEEGSEKKKSPVKAILILLAAAFLCFCFVHFWSEPTCTEPATCSLCGQEKGEPLGHEWVEASCEEPKHCTQCDATEGKAKGHKWVAASCTKAKHCPACDKVEGEALGHSWIDATYDAPQTCSRCSQKMGNPKGYVGTVNGSYKGDRFYRSGRRTSAYTLERKIEDCIAFTLNYNITEIEEGNVYGNFEVFVRYGKEEWEWQSVGVVEIEQNEVSIVFEPDPAVSFDAVAVVCQANSNYSYSAYMTITDVQVLVD